MVPLVLRRLVPSAYRPVLANRVFRRLILGFGVSYLGDGMSFVAVAWLAIELAPQATAGLWVGGAVAAYTLPGVVGALVFGRRLRRVPAKRLLLADNVRARRVSRRHPARLARRAAYAVAVRHAALGLVAAARLGQRGQVHPAGRAAARRAAARREYPRQLAQLRCHDRRACDRRCVGDVCQLRARARPGRSHLRVPRRACRAHPAAGVEARVSRRPGCRPRRARVAAVPSRAARAADAHLVLQPAVWPGRGRPAAPRDRRPARTGHIARRLLDAVRHRRGTRWARSRRTAPAAALACDGPASWSVGGSRCCRSGSTCRRP